MDRQINLTKEEKNREQSERELHISQYFVNSVQQAIDEDSAYAEYFSTSLKTELEKFKIPE